MADVAPLAVQFSRRRAMVQPILRMVAEAAWITVVYAAVSVIADKHAPILGPLELLVFVLAGLGIGWWGKRHTDAGPVLLIAAVIVGSAVGWLASPQARDLLPNFPAAFDHHLAGWMAGIAVLRGSLIEGGEKAAEDVEKLLRRVPIALALIWAYAEIAAEPHLWLPFAVAALWGTVAFLSAAAVSIGLARLHVLHARVVDQTQRRGWRLLVGVIGFGIVPIAVPIGIVSGIPISALVTPVVGPFQFVLSVLVIPLSFIVWIVAEVLRPFAGGLGELLDAIQRRNEERERQQQAEQLANDLISDAMTVIGLALWALTILVLAIAIYSVARWLLRRRNVLAEELDDGDADTEHAILVPAADPKQSRRRRVRRPVAPHDAVAAYMGALAVLDDHPELARLPNETPAQHAARLRASDVDGARELGRLAAAYQLARYGERRITALENVRAVTRFQRVRRLLRAPNA